MGFSISKIKKDLELGDTGPGADTVDISFGTSFATADNPGAKKVIPKIPKTVVVPNTKYFRFDLGLLLAFSKFS